MPLRLLPLRRGGASLGAGSPVGAITLALVLLTRVISADVVLEDFEGSVPGQASSGGRWFILLDARSHAQGNSVLLHPPAFTNPVADSGFESPHCGRIAVRLGPGYRSPFAGMGFNLDANRGWYDVRNAQIEFRARGRGVWNIKLRDSWNYYQTPSSQNLQVTFTVGPQWSLYRFGIGDFSLPANSVGRRAGMGVKNLADSVSSILFVTSSYRSEDAGTEVDLRIDAIVVRGVERIGDARITPPPPLPITAATDGLFEDDPWEGEDDRESPGD